MISIRALPFLILATCASAQILGLDLFGNPIPVGATITPGGSALVNANVIAGLLSTSDCASNSLVGVQSAINLGSILKTCLCVQAIGNLDPTKTACPGCPANAQAGCGSGSCTCVCDSGFTVSAAGTCIVLAASQRARQRRSQLLLDAAKRAASIRNLDSERCPSDETACPVANGDGFECLDTTSSLDSCGGCPGNGGQDCLALPGALKVGCVDSKCRALSCLPGWRFMHVTGRCVPA